MSKPLGRNYEDPDSQRWWAAAEKAAANRRKLIIPATPSEMAKDTPTVQAAKLPSSDEDKHKA